MFLFLQGRTTMASQLMWNKCEGESVASLPSNKAGMGNTATTLSCQGACLPEACCLCGVSSLLGQGGWRLWFGKAGVGRGKKAGKRLKEPHLSLPDTV